MLKRLVLEEARGCVALGGIYLLFHWNADEDVEGRAWPAGEALKFRSFLGSLRDEDWEVIKSFGVCSPPDGYCLEEGPALGWHHLLHHKLDLTGSLARLRMPDGAHILMRLENGDAMERILAD